MTDSISRVSVENDVNGPIDPPCTDVIVVRHGETDWNAFGKIQGQLDVELNEIGRQQAVAVADRLSREPNISAIYSSDLKRALETAEKIASKYGGLEVIKEKDLRERHLGDLQGRVYQESAKLNPIAYAAFKSHRSDQEIPGGGESRDQLYKRCTSLLQKIGEKHRGERVIVVSHGGAIRSLFNRAAAKGQNPGKIMNTSVGIIQLFDGDKWCIKSWNDVSHLTKTEFLESAFGGDASSG
ncbi:phosphoglycerate mutase-like protein 4 [Amaranthus tricolor]|uniref:phosphoglycerate mutase-like protein 4 n=1 Tax=Amaranthus tricolor TaxID=29722 RepID=UPI00258CCCC5|nr:phosphoglycerate mutase-like protein 4 [Amaranthus tricolor]